MGFVDYGDDFKVETVDFKVRDEKGDYISSYIIMSHKPFEEVKEWCMEKLHKSYEKFEMPNIFSPELIEFKQTTNLEIEIGEIFRYKVKSHNKS